MKEDPDKHSDAALRRLAEERLKAREPIPQSPIRNPQSEPRLVHELQVHQIGLEMQNEELQQARAKADALLAQYTDLYDFAPTGYLTLDREGAIRQVNLAGALLLGVERSRLANRRFGQFVAESDRHPFGDFLEQVFANEAKACCEVTLPREGSQLLVVRIEGRRSEDGQECRAVVLDITESKQAEVAMRESDEDYRMLFREMINGFALHEIICDEAGNPSDYRFLAVNPAFERMTGLKAAETVGRTVLEILPDTERSWIERYGKVAITGVPVSFENYAASMKKHFEVVAFRPKIKQFACFFHDITGCKRADEALRASAQMIEEVISAVPVRIFWKDKQLAYLGCNASFARDAGFADPKELIGKDDFQMGWREQAELYRADDRAVIESGRAKLLIEESQTTPAGDTITLLMNKVPLRDSQGEISGVLGTYMDITQHKRADEALRQKYAELARINNVMVGRELRMIELKAEINALLKAAGQPEKYKIV